jgi:hypothetical protein
MTQSLSPSPLPLWLDWVLSATPSGLLLLDAESNIVFANKWFLLRARVSVDEIVGRGVRDVFAVLQGSHFERALVKAMRSGFPAFVTLHPSPFPLYAPAATAVSDNLLRQSIHIVPMGPTDAAAAGQRYILIQIADVSPTVARERLLKAHADRMSDLVHIDALTGIGNRRFFDEAMAAELRAASRTGTSLGLSCWILTSSSSSMICMWSSAGDRCLRAVADVVRRCATVRAIWWRAMAAKELAAILPDTDDVARPRSPGHTAEAA